MKDSLLVGDHLFAKKFAYGISTPHIPFLEIPLIPGTDGHILSMVMSLARGDIVIFRYPNNTQLHYVKRCVALPGDELFLTRQSPLPPPARRG
jgi:signal peptidase I